jgi:hypothetical protein
MKHQRQRQQQKKKEPRVFVKMTAESVELTAQRALEWLFIDTAPSRSREFIVIAADIISSKFQYHRPFNPRAPFVAAGRLATAQENKQF